MPIHHEFKSRLSLNANEASDAKPPLKVLPDHSGFASMASKPIGVPANIKSDPIPTNARSVPERTSSDDWSEPSIGSMSMPKALSLSSILGRDEGFAVLSDEWDQQERVENRLDFPSPPVTMDLGFLGSEDSRGLKSPGRTTRTPRNTLMSLLSKRAASTDIPDDNGPDAAAYTYMSDRYSFNSSSSPTAVNLQHDIIPVLDFERIDSTSGFNFPSESHHQEAFQTEENTYSTPEMKAMQEQQEEQLKNFAQLGKSLDPNLESPVKKRYSDMAALDLGPSLSSPTTVKFKRRNNFFTRPTSAMSSSSDSSVGENEKFRSFSDNESDDEYEHNKRGCGERLSSSLPVSRKTPRFMLEATSCSSTTSPINIQEASSGAFGTSQLQAFSSPSLTALAYTPPEAALPAITLTSSPVLQPKVPNADSSSAAPPKAVKAVVPTSDTSTLPAQPGDNIVSVGVYTKAQRRAKIFRYRQKKDRRSGKRIVIYTCRKAFADQRPRVGGRFVKNTDNSDPAAKSGESEVKSSSSAKDKKDSKKKGVKKVTQIGKMVRANIARKISKNKK